ncbi:hypothetical protein GCM10007927_02560 [Sulfitobacter pacificus]|uniref:Uncharacterized protein n=2 Tax=Sulfitobacter pacificus TaxID=1499314 RepID=A0ABQ5VDJ8_9RHOB|nr:hypothetical protein GCM10007927_02560 [Sulfitobacter pacificus]
MLVFILLVACIGSGYLAFKISDDRERMDFERRNSHGVREYKNWDERKEDRVHEGMSNAFGVFLGVVSAICGLLCALVWAAG